MIGPKLVGCPTNVRLLVELSQDLDQRAHEVLVDLRQREPSGARGAKSRRDGPLLTDGEPHQMCDQRLRKARMRSIFRSPEQEHELEPMLGREPEEFVDRRTIGIARGQRAGDVATP